MHQCYHNLFQERKKKEMETEMNDVRMCMEHQMADNAEVANSEYIYSAF